MSINMEEIRQLALQHLANISDEQLEEELRLAGIENEPRDARAVFSLRGGQVQSSACCNFLMPDKVRVSRYSNYARLDRSTAGQWSTPIYVYPVQSFGCLNVSLGQSGRTTVLKMGDHGVEFYEKDNANGLYEGAV